MRALMVRYRLGNLFVCKHELLLSKCPLTADWLLIRPVWNEISNEALNYNPIPEHIISHTYCMPLSVSQCFIYFCQLFYLTPFSSTSSCFVTTLYIKPLISWPLGVFSLSGCNCSGRSDECMFDLEQYRSTGSGGRCVNCRDHTDGPHCERCKENYYREFPEEPCRPCNCNING